jgi:hypothetical protein
VTPACVCVSSKPVHLEQSALLIHTENNTRAQHTHTRASTPITLLAQTTSLRVSEMAISGGGGVNGGGSGGGVEALFTTLTFAKEIHS